ncbi:hypothetical protein EYF80_048124 [Liparis tanakae]|uniref:Uncharacterized protein n=1 Tax=Liparis tanakae TaxID=230148 RepID=A0A4Z2FLD8_9TELE|nr:hypothetical protein EYF80_048124 [Liparis tanakae]
MFYRKSTQTNPSARSLDGVRTGEEALQSITLSVTFEEAKLGLNSDPVCLPQSQVCSVQCNILLQTPGSTAPSLSSFPQLLPSAPSLSSFPQLLPSTVIYAALTSRSLLKSDNF